MLFFKLFMMDGRATTRNIRNNVLRQKSPEYTYVKASKVVMTYIRYLKVPPKETNVPFI